MTQKTKKKELPENHQYETINKAYEYMLNGKTYDTMKFVEGFIGKFFLKYSLVKTENYASKKDKSNKNSIDLYSKEEGDYESIWDLLILFIETLFRGKPIGDMKKQLEVIKRFAANLADIIEKDVHDKLYKKIYGKGNINVDDYRQWENFLTKLLQECAETKEKLIFSLDDFTNLFIQSVTQYKMSWKTVRNLIIIALTQELFKRGYFSKNKEKNSDIQYDTYDVNNI